MSEIVLTIWFYRLMTESATANQKLISIIIATYNCGRKIEDTLQSILCQDKELFELIVLDGNSTDNTLDFVRKYENDLTLISERDDGIYFAFNKGIDLAKGRYLYFIGAGDCLKPNILEQLVKYLPSEPPSVVYGRVYFVKHKHYNGQEFIDELFIRDNLCQQGIFYHRNVFDIIGKFDLKYKVFADWFFNLKCFIHKGINKKFINYVIADYEEGGVSAKIGNDPAFKKDFPVFVRKNFGVGKALICRAFLTEPHVFNYIYFSKYRFLPGHFIYNYSFIGYLISPLKPVVRIYRALKKALKNRI